MAATKNNSARRDADEVKLRGVIKSIKVKEQFGFITQTATGIDHFFHRSELQQTTAKGKAAPEWGPPLVGKMAEFTQIDNPPRGWRAVDVVILD